KRFGSESFWRFDSLNCQSLHLATVSSNMMKYIIPILIFPFLFVSCSQVESIRVDFYPAFIANSSLKINSDSIELSVAELSFIETRAINKSDFKTLIKFLNEYDYRLLKEDDLGPEDGITVRGSLSINSMNHVFDFVSPAKGTNDNELSQLLLSISERHFKNQTSLNYLSCLSEYFPFSLNYHCDSCEAFSYSNISLASEGKMVTLDNGKTQIEVYLICDTMPEFPGGINALKKYIVESSQNCEILQSYTEASIIYVSFIVLKNGKLANIKIIRNGNPKIEKEIIRLFESIPIWRPGIIESEPVNVEYVIPIKIRQ
ncbi:hypothetical protein, partial [Carboxylicivirga marina]|uniref:hypothetical protein n=1 Tax=Carboxylicivirga marina TaxID=2800988 RepID=UPI002595C596